MSKKLFDYVIGNPPYNENSIDTSDKPIYNDFMDASFDVAEKVELIHPARFLFNAGKTPKAWNNKMLNDPHFKVLKYEQTSAKVFANTDIKGGIAITVRDESKDYGAIVMFTNYPELNSILRKTLKSESFKSIDEQIYLQNRWKLETLYEDFPELKIPYIDEKGKERYPIGSEGKERRLTTSIFNLTQVFSESKKQNMVEILGLVDNKRIVKYVDRKYLDDGQENFEKWKVILPKSNGTGAIGEVLSTPLIGEPLIGFTQSFISIGSFNNRDEAENCLKYIKSKYSRTMLGVLKITQDNNKDTWKYVPTQNFKADSDIDWSKSIPEIDQQLYKMYGLNETEINFIESHVKEMA